MIMSNRSCTQDLNICMKMNVLGIVKVYVCLGVYYETNDPNFCFKIRENDTSIHSNFTKIHFCFSKKKSHFCPPKVTSVLKNTLLFSHFFSFWKFWFCGAKNHFCFYKSHFCSLIFVKLKWSQIYQKPHVFFLAVESHSQHRILFVIWSSVCANVVSYVKNLAINEGNVMTIGIILYKTISMY